MSINEPYLDPGHSFNAAAMKMTGCLFFLLVAASSQAADSLVVHSPDRKIQVTIAWNNALTYSIRYDSRAIMTGAGIDLELGNGSSLSDAPRPVKKSLREVDEWIYPPVQDKRKQIRDHYNELRLDFKHSFSLLFRIYDDGVAYRILTRFKDSIIIKNELARFDFPPGQRIVLPIMNTRPDMDRFHTSFEELYLDKQIDSLGPETIAYSPVLVGSAKTIRIGVTESDLEDYPGMFISGTNGTAIKGVFANYPLVEKMTQGEFPQAIVTQRADYIAKTAGTRNFPWRVLIIAPEDKDLPGNELVYRLGAPSRLTATGWIHPGKGTDEWIIGVNLFNVPFRTGINTAVYKFYIDFARRFSFDRIMLDAGWSNYQDLFDINPNINMDTLAAYAKSQGIKLSMWTLASTLERQLDSALVQFNKWGVDFIMTDFMDRDDQRMVNFYHRIAKACADHQLMIMYHGAFAPKGFNRTWPNAITREGVLGSEYNIWSDKVTPGHDLTLPFTRMLAGSMDYEPGILDNATASQFRPINQKVMSQGTRCHQLAMFVVYDSPLQIFSGNPSQGLLEPAFMELLGSIPTTWDETRILEASVSHYIITARQKGADWFIGGMTDWDKRNFTIATTFLAAGEYEAVLCEDGINAASYPSDYVIRKFEVKAGESISLQLASGGGFLVRLRKVR